MSDDRVSQRPTRPGERVALSVSEITDEEAALIQASQPVHGERYSLDDIPDITEPAKILQKRRRDPE